ncbi:LppU family putative lipoprotein [Mycobacterium heckeshornense]|uniref:LppU family putative lipoprotein n=1 Tax=Mycobacterium heckeshornense TaxID=110505 RepID=UPI001943869F|nr:hypothetical protein [Mycobacterium heckeshornense]
MTQPTRALAAAAITAIALTACSGWSPEADTVDLRVGDCLRLGGIARRPVAVKVACGSRASNFKVAATVPTREQCPGDVDSAYSARNGFSETHTACLDIDWAVGECMSVDPDNRTDPVPADCNDESVPHRQRATQILTGLSDPVSVDQCLSGVGYAYAERRFAVCVEDVG